MQADTPIHGPYDALTLRFTIEAFELHFSRFPNDLGAAQVLAFAYTDAGDYEKGLKMDRLLYFSQPNEPLVSYNLACSLSLTGNLDEAVDALLRAIGLGYDEFEHLFQDSDLEAVRGCKRFKEVEEKM